MVISVPYVRLRKLESVWNGREWEQALSGGLDGMATLSYSQSRGVVWLFAGVRLDMANHHQRPVVGFQQNTGTRMGNTKPE